MIWTKKCKSVNLFHLSELLAMKYGHVYGHCIMGSSPKVANTEFVPLVKSWITVGILRGIQEGDLAEANNIWFETDVLRQLMDTTENKRYRRCFWDILCSSRKYMEDRVRLGSVIQNWDGENQKNRNNEDKKRKATEW